MEPEVTTPQPSKQAPIETLPSKPFWKSKFLWGFVGVSFLAAFIIGGIAIGRHQAGKTQTQVSTSPTPTCIPRPKCLDATPACKIMETSNMCPKDETANWKTYSGNVFSLKYPPTWFLSPGTQSVTLSDAEITKDSNQVVQVSFFEDEVPIGLTSSTRVYIKNPNGGYAILEDQSGDRKTFSQIVSTFKFTNSTNSNPSQSNGANLENIKYTLPSGWSAKTQNGGLLLAPESGGGYLTIGVHNYDGKSGRREAYCKIVGYCTDSTYFTPMQIGNISGYKANALDNSGGGPDYFAAKGDKFYIIGSYTPPSPNEFEKSYQSLLNSLVF